MARDILTSPQLDIPLAASDFGLICLIVFSVGVTIIAAFLIWTLK